MDRNFCFNTTIIFSIQVFFVMIKSVILCCMLCHFGCHQYEIQDQHGTPNLINCVLKTSKNEDFLNIYNVHLKKELPCITCQLYFQSPFDIRSNLTFFFNVSCEFNERKISSCNEYLGSCKYVGCHIIYKYPPLKLFGYLVGCSHLQVIWLRTTLSTQHGFL